MNAPIWVKFTLEYRAAADSIEIQEVLKTARSSGYARILSVVAPVPSPDEDDWSEDDV